MPFRTEGGHNYPCHKKESFFKDQGFIDFFKENKEWLLPYAAFCFFRDKNETSDFNKWKSYKSYSEDGIKKLASPSKEYDNIALHYFIQYHLHLQFKEVSEYANKNGIALKGDVPIGVSGTGCDVWVNPSLYNVREQAGAPPDSFTVNGQNWGFPTYNWDTMQQDGFEWWRKRFQKMDEYFDAFRIDHILGFFRIWSIPVNAVQGVLGRFIPAVPIHQTEFGKMEYGLITIDIVILLSMMRF